MKPQNVIKLHVHTTHVLYDSNNTVIFFLELNSSSAQFYINIQNIPQLWPFYTYLLRFKAGAPLTEHYQLVRELSADAVVTVL